MTTFVNPHHPSATVKDDCNWQDFFGEPRGPINTDPYSAFPRETLHLPEVYNGNNPYLTNVMLRIIDEEQLVPTKILLPIRQAGNDTSIVWDEFYFNNTLLGPVPEEGVSRLVTQQVSEHRDHFVRYGLAFMIEHGFMKTPKGRMTYKNNLEQIRDAILQSLYIGVIEALLRCKTSSQLFMQCYGKALTVATARKRLKLEVEAFAEIQKSDHGWDMLNSRAQRVLKAVSGVTPDAWILDDGVKKYIAGVRRENFDYFLKGPAGPKLYAENLGAGNPTSLDVAANCLIFECKSFNIPGYDDPVNITSRRRTIGEVMVSFPHVEVREKYTSAQRDILVYDEDRDGFRKLGIRDGLANCCRFDEFGAPKFPDNFDGQDMFRRRDGEGWKNLKYLGQMTEDALPEEAIRDWTASVVAGCGDPSSIANGLVVLKNLVEKLDGTPDGDEDFKYFDRLAKDHGSANLDSGTRMPILVGGEFKNQIPYGYGS